MGDEGVKRNADAVELILNAIEAAGYRPGEDVVLALDPASNGVYEEGLDHLRTEGRKVGAEEMMAMYADWVAKYPIGQFHRRSHRSPRHRPSEDRRAMSRHFLHFAHAMPATPEGISKTSFRMTRCRRPQPWHTMNFGNKSSIIR